MGFTSQGGFLDWAPSLLAQAGPFAFLAGIGLVCTGVVLDEVQKWDVFVKYNVLFILVPALLGLKVCALNRSVNPLRDSLYRKKPQIASRSDGACRMQTRAHFVVPARRVTLR
jgi:hypothetical protein